MNPEITRRGLLAVAASTATCAISSAHPEVDVSPTEPFGYCLNTSTIRINDGNWGKPRPIVESIDIAAKAGYGAIEPWISEIDAYIAGGGKIDDLRKRIVDAGLKVPDAIGFAEWLADDDAKRKKGLEQAKRDMDLIQNLGTQQIAAPPAGMTGTQLSDLSIAADRYRILFDLGKTMGITPIVEVWGFSKTLRKLGDVVLVATESGRAEAAILPDIYHLYKGHSEFAGLGMLAPSAIGIFHINDYPNLDRAKIVDADRVYPGDGIAPLRDVMTSLKKMKYRGYLSLELFNRSYWKQDPLIVAKTGLEKLKATVRAAS